MKQALICLEEIAYKFDGSIIGRRVVQVSDQTFEVSPTLIWVECADDVVADQFFYDTTSASIIAIPVLPPPPVVPPGTKPVVL